MTLHYLNQGRKYHIGNNSYASSIDREFIDAYPVIGEAWAQPFTVSKDDIVEVIIENLWGVDYGSQPSNIQVSINETRIGQVNVNRQKWSSPTRCQVSPGHTYMLKIASYGPDDPDDFVMEGVIIQTAQGASAIPAGQAKMLQHPDDDYYSSTYDQGIPVSLPVQNGACVVIPPVIPPVLCNSPTAAHPAPPLPNPAQPCQTSKKIVDRNETFRVTGEWLFVVTDSSGSPPPIKACWKLGFERDYDYPCITMYGLPKDFPGNTDRWGRWVKTDLLACSLFRHPKRGHEGTILKKHFVQLEFIQQAVSSYNIYRLYCREDEANRFITVWENINP